MRALMLAVGLAWGMIDILIAKDPATVETRLAMRGMIKHAAFFQSATVAQKAEIGNFLCSQYFLYWVSTSKLGEARNIHIENVIGMLVVDMWGDESFRRGLKNPLAVKEPLGDGDLRVSYGNKFEISSKEEYRVATSEFEGFVELLRQKRIKMEKNLMESHEKGVR